MTVGEGIALHDGDNGCLGGGREDRNCNRLACNILLVARHGKRFRESDGNIHWSVGHNVSNRMLLEFARLTGIAVGSVADVTSKEHFVSLGTSIGFREGVFGIWLLSDKNGTVQITSS